MSNITCFLIQPTNRYVVSLRRFTYADQQVTPCTSGNPYKSHDCSVTIGIEQHEKTPCSGDTGVVPHDDPRWPMKCPCGYVFTPGDVWQVCYDKLYRADDGREFTLRGTPWIGDDHKYSAPAGAMWRATWMEPHYAGPDGCCYVVKTPGGDWMIDGPSSSGGRWTRTGIAPKFTANPSILIGGCEAGGYHGWLRDGTLVSC